MPSAAMPAGGWNLRLTPPRRARRRMEPLLMRSSAERCARYRLVARAARPLPWPGRHLPPCLSQH
jgi:hypothetical protein